jgi:hypothetical protein
MSALNNVTLGRIRPRTPERGCGAAPAPDPIWTSGPPTPAEEYPTAFDPCAAGLAGVTEHTARWLHQAQVYHLQSAGGGNALVLADQLCAEARYQELTCLAGDADGMAALAAMHGQACGFADHLARTALVGDPLRPNEVRSKRRAPHPAPPRTDRPHRPVRPPPLAPLHLSTADQRQLSGIDGSCHRWQLSSMPDSCRHAAAIADSWHRDDRCRWHRDAIGQRLPSTAPPQDSAD